MASIGTEKGRNFAAHAIAKIAISVDPHLAFHDQYATRAVAPLMSLLKSEDGLQQFESSMALTNLSVLGEDFISLMLRNNGLSTIENLQISQNEMIQRASSELLCNLLQFSDVLELYHEEVGTERRLLMWKALAHSEDKLTAKAASGTMKELMIEKTERHDFVMPFRFFNHEFLHWTHLHRCPCYSFLRS